MQWHHQHANHVNRTRLPLQAVLLKQIACVMLDFSQDCLILKTCVLHALQGHSRRYLVIVIAKIVIQERILLQWAQYQSSLVSIAYKGNTQQHWQRVQRQVVFLVYRASTRSPYLLYQIQVVLSVFKVNTQSHYLLFQI